MKFKKLLKFYEISEIFDLRSKFEYSTISDSEIQYVYNMFENNNIMEGVFYSFSTENVKNIINRKFNNIHVEIESLNSIYLFDNILENLTDLKRYIRLFGWYIATIQESSELNYSRYDDNIKYSRIYSISIEPNYDTKIDNIPNILYHVTLETNLNSILKRGLIPKNKSKIAYHPDRIYLTNYLNSANYFKKYLEQTSNKSAIILKIDTQGIEKLYSDVNWKENGFYVVNNINKEFIKVL